jgi:hypothetical protein
MKHVDVRETFAPEATDFSPLPVELEFNLSRTASSGYEESMHTRNSHLQNLGLAADASSRPIRTTMMTSVGWHAIHQAFSRDACRRKWLRLLQKWQHHHQRYCFWHTRASDVQSLPLAIQQSVPTCCPWDCV